MVWMTTLVLTLSILDSVHAEKPRRLRNVEIPPATAPRGRLSPAAQTVVLQPARKQRQSGPQQQQASLDLQTVTGIVLTTATLSALIVGVACYACRSKSPAHRGASGSCGRYVRLEGPSTPDFKRTLRLSPVGPFFNVNRDQWASISLVNLLNTYPSPSTTKVAAQHGDHGGGHLGPANDTT
ncbi:hypothetical protein HPB47_027025 [Ixodes persulcatus]|uniref:Uncharacterized protein n=1 Tax=Ixodes persulcatus TaxID=34615 RepID=A0AC60PXK6_IXOPE|nr:hypothetical protein HPB47_027025 [Ixodes persulcatus]